MASGLENIETIESPFRRFVTTIGVFPTAFTDAMTYYECLAYLVKYLEETVIPAVNENAEALAELQQYYIQLKSYVDNYFANLDVQEEINNKLDQMAEDGTLQEIITTYIQANVAWTFDTVAEMKTATNLVAGSYAQTLGFYSLNDGGGATYYITDSGTANEMDVIAVGSLYANLVTSDSFNIRQVGAKCDGETDDSDVIQRCIDIIGNDTKTIVFNNDFPLIITKEIELTNVKNIDFIFKGKIHRASSESTSTMFKLVGCENCKFENLYIYSERDQNEEPPAGHTRISAYGSNIIGVYMQGVKNITFEGCYFQNMASDFFNQPTSENESSNNITISNWVSSNCSLPLFMQYLSNVKIDNAHVEVAENMGTGDHFLYFSKYAYNVIVTNSYFKSPDGNYGVSIAFNNTGDAASEANCPKHLVMDNCYIENAKAVIVMRYLSDAVLNNCEFKFNNADYFLSMFNSSNVRFINCKASGSMTNFITVNDTVDISIKDSEIKISGTPSTQLINGVSSGAKVELINNYLSYNKALLYGGTTGDGSTVIIKDNIITQHTADSYLLTNRNGNNTIKFISNDVVNTNAKTNLMWNNGASNGNTYIYFNTVKGFSQTANETDITSINNNNNYFIN